MLKSGKVHICFAVWQFAFVGLAGWLQHIQSLDNQNIGAADGDGFAGHDIIGEMRVDRRFDI